MGKIKVTIKLEELRVVEQNESSPDEPYILPVFARVDSYINDLTVPLDQKTFALFFPPGLGHGDLGSDSDDMTSKGNSAVDVPSAIGERTMTLDVSRLAGLTPLMANCFAGFGVGVFEEDATASSTVKDGISAAIVAIRNQANAILRGALAGTIDVSEATDSGSIMEAVLDSILPKAAGQAIGKLFIPGVEIGHWISLIAQITDRDDFVGAAAAQFSFWDLVGKAHRESDVTLEFGKRGGEEGFYQMFAHARRADADEAPLIATIRSGGDTMRFFARSLTTDDISMQFSDDRGKTWQPKGSKAFQPIAMRSGPGADSSQDGSIQAVAAFDESGILKLSRSSNSGTTWTDWTSIPGLSESIGSPAVAVSPDGTFVCIVARNADKTYWSIAGNLSEAVSSWTGWRRIGSRTFKSSPSVVWMTGRLGSSGKAVVSGLSGAGVIFKTRFSPLGNKIPDGIEWEPLKVDPLSNTPTSAFTSAPAMYSDGDERIVLVCRGNDLRYHRIESFDSGHDFGAGTNWSSIGRHDLGKVRYAEDGTRKGDLQAMYSAPSVVAWDIDHWTLVGLSPTLTPWRNRSSRNEPKIWRPLTQSEPELALRGDYY